MNEFLSRAVTYMKAVESGASASVPDDDSPVLTRLTDDVAIAYVVDEPQGLVFVQKRHLREAGISTEQLHRQAMANLDQLCDTQLNVEKHGPIFGVFLNGVFEASVFLRERFWQYEALPLVNRGYAVAMPARDVLAFCDMDSKEGIDRLQQMTQRVMASGDHLLTPKLFRLKKKAA
ncbi:DUF1444 family protein [Massilia sp. Dwa41.01b]|uniref:DUF1444 family protein n=1 Tax=unclassified Massilia TaxID=2609279 RepID=UPI00160079F2|nr:MULTISPECIES: DUF1444 family protein [unclassified Massilia]QNA90302.1 DUF1444 family protein [Massilia sp. Dwa41.01b]QNB01202.1 DUF1444 family protein [Massilia sp. Se16.2.3]